MILTVGFVLYVLAVLASVTAVLAYVAVKQAYRNRVSSCECKDRVPVRADALLDESNVIAWWCPSCGKTCYWLHWITEGTGTS